MGRTKLTITGATEAKAPPAEGLAEQAYRAILQGLTDLTIPVGVDISQSALMRLLNLTSQPLRDALRTLAAEGLITIKARSSIRFIKADLELSRSIYQFRSLIERPGARALAEQGDKALITELLERHRALASRIQDGELGAEEEELLATLEDELHGALIAALRNDLVERAAERLRNYLTIVRRDRLVTKPLALRTLSEHMEILEACKDRDGDLADAAVNAHFQRALQRMLGM